MEPSTLECKTLGQKHENINKKVIELLSHIQEENLSEINYNDSDIQNIIKIEIACQLKFFNYILEIFKCKDLLYVSKAIKQSTWLITDPQYRSIVDPDFIHHQLKPFMTTKAYNKFILNIRKHLRDEKKVDKFFDYYEQVDLIKAFKWLPHASSSLIKRVLKIYAKEIPSKIIKRIVKKSDYVYTFCQDVCSGNYYNDFEKIKEILQCDRVKCMDYIDNFIMYQIPKLSSNKTKKIMRKCPEIILNNISKYISKVHIKTFANLMHSDNITSFLISNSCNPYMKPLYKYDKLKYFVLHINEEERIKFIKTVFIDKKDIEYTTENYLINNTMIRCLTNMNNEYLWYEIIPFDKAFVDLKKMIACESNPHTKSCMLRTLIASAYKKQENIYEILKYYHTHHISEHNKYKGRFVDDLLCKMDIYHCNETSWNLLNNIFFSMGIYTEINIKHEKYVDIIIVYNAIHHYPIPDVIMNNFKYKTFKSIQSKITKSESIILFQFLMEFNFNELQEHKMSKSNEFETILESLKNTCELFCHWKKTLNHYPRFVHKINEIIVFLINERKQKGLEKLFQIGKCLNRHILYEQMLINIPGDKYFMYGLKHNPNIFHGQAENILGPNKKFPKIQFFRKLRVYWYDSLAIEFKNVCSKALCDIDYNSIDHLKVLLILFSQNETKTFLEDYRQPKSFVAARRKALKMLYVCRPLTSIEYLLSYTDRSSNLKDGLTANFLLHNMNESEYSHFILQFQHLSTALQKLILKTAPFKMSHNQIANFYQGIWNNTENRSKRSIIFKCTFNLLCASKKDTVSKDTWEILSMFIKQLGTNENKKIYELLCNINNVPLNVRGNFYEKSNELLKQLPDDTYHTKLNNNLDPDFYDLSQKSNTEDVLKENNNDLQNLKIKPTYVLWLPEYLINSETEESQMERYNAVLLPFLNHVLEVWDKGNHVRNNFLYILERMYDHLKRDLLTLRILPIAMFSDIQEKMTQKLSFDENYLFIRSLSLSVYFLQSLEKCDKRNSENDIFSQACKQFGKVCNDQLYEDIKKYSSAIYIVFGKALQNSFGYHWASNKETLNMLNELLLNNPLKETFFVVIDLLPKTVHYGDEFNFRSKLIETLMQHPSHEIKMYLKNSLIQM